MHQDGHAGASGTSSVGRYSLNSLKGRIGGQSGQCNTARGNCYGDVGAGWRAQRCARAEICHGV